MTSKTRKISTFESDQARVATSTTQLEVRFADTQSKLAPGGGK